ncbi:hypothetical protein UFOVP395_96 [uncultured Caudovirales phage]|uniref:Peptidase M15A, C-terminal n=1 Tax=uncultured Caudovirales phage TaxID=2100421 RepID=A0A6J5M3K2_9CAUD|nr:hypothetical protein UFOVP395_96 [uncultured Caudovirales phage]
MPKFKYDPKEEMRRENERRAAMGLPPVPPDFSDLEAKENERRAAMGLPPSPPGAWDPIPMMSSNSRLPRPRKAVEKPVELPEKKEMEPDDSIVVADKNDNLAKVGTGSQSQGAGEASTQAPDTGQRSGATKSLILRLGSLTFNKMFPTLGRLMEAFDNRIRKQDSDLERVNVNNQENARQVSRSSVFLSRIAENQLRTNELLEQIITAASQQSGTLVPPNPAPNINAEIELDGPRRRRAAAAGQATPDRRSAATQSGQGAGAPRPGAAPSGRNPAAIIAASLGFATAGFVAGSAIAATRPTAATPSAQQTNAGGTSAAGSGAMQEQTEAAIPALPVPPAMTREATRRTAAPITEQEQAELFANRVLNIKAKDIIFKADRFEFDEEATGSAATPFTPTAASAGRAAVAGATGAAVAGTSSQIQTIVQRISQEFPNVNVTSALRPGDTNSQHAHGNAVDLSLRGLSQEQRATLVQNLTSGRYGNVGGLGTYNATGDLLHVDTRSGARMAWGPNRSRTSLDQTPQWFQTAVMPWMGGSATAAAQQEPSGAGQQAATPAPSTPSSGAQVAQASVRSEVSTMQSQQVSASLGEAPEQPAAPTGSREMSATMIDPNEPGSVEPPDAAQRYAKLFNFAA